MATKTVANPSSAAGTTEERHKLATEAAYEIESISRVLQGLDDTDDKLYLMRGLLQRIETLSGVIMSATGTGDQDREVADMRTVVFGHHSLQQLEVAHG